MDEANDQDQRMSHALGAIRGMLDETPSLRPKSKGLWTSFASVSKEKCRDCDPRHEEVWKPSETQKQNHEDGKSNRRSMHMISEETADGSPIINGDSTLRFGGIDSSLLSAQDPRSSYRQRRSSSPHVGGARRAGSPLAVPNGQPSSPHHMKRASSPDSRSQLGYNRGSMMATSPPRPPTPTTSSNGLTKTTSHPRSPSPQKRRPPYLENRNQSGILQEPPSAFQTQHMNKRNSITRIPASPRASRQALKSNSGDLPEKEAKHTSSNGTQHATLIDEGEKPQPLTDVIIYDYSGELVYVAAFASLRGRDYRSYPLAKGQIIEIGEKPKIIAKVDLGSLGWWIKIRRMKGDFPRIYVLNIPAG